MGPPDTMTTGMSSRAAAMTMPGTTLSQLGIEHQAVESVRLDHDLDRIGDDLARHQRVVHALVVHGDAVADADDVELQRHAAGLPHAELDLLGEGAEVHVPGDQLVVGVGDTDQKPLGVIPAYPQRAQQRTVRGASGTGDRRSDWCSSRQTPQKGMDATGL